MLKLRTRRSYSYSCWLIAAALLLVACRTGGAADGAPDIQMTLAPADPAPPVMGPFQWDITLVDSAGAPIEDAAVTVRGDMNHAGMVPVEATAVYEGEGLYTAEFEWTMVGDWIVTATASLADGRQKSLVVEVAVAVD